MCPKLEHIHFTNAPMLSDKTLSAIVRGCPFIRSIVIGGPAATPEVIMAGGRNQAAWMFQGAISGAALDELLKDKSLAANLELLDLGNQPFAINEKYEDYGESITEARRRLYYVDGYGGDRNLYFGGEVVDSNVEELDDDFDDYDDDSHYDDDSDRESWEDEYDGYEFILGSER